MSTRAMLVITVIVALAGCSSETSGPQSPANSGRQAPTSSAMQMPAGSKATPFSDEQKIHVAMSAAPADISANAAIVEPDASGHMKQLRAGTNGWVCMARPEVMCLDKQWQSWAEAWMNKTDPKVTAVGVAYMLQGDKGASNTDPFATAETPDNHWVVSPAHVMILTPDTRQLDALPTDPNNGGPWVMWKGTKYAHIMVPTVAMPGK